jgi:hypothetical protein
VLSEGKAALASSRGCAAIRVSTAKEADGCLQSDVDVAESAVKYMWPVPMARSRELLSFYPPSINKRFATADDGRYHAPPPTHPHPPQRCASGCAPRCFLYTCALPFFLHVRTCISSKMPISPPPDRRQKSRIGPSPIFGAGRAAPRLDVERTSVASVQLVVVVQAHRRVRGAVGHLLRRRRAPLQVPCSGHTRSPYQN